jgi:peptidoglycan/LPS O-acetylase OafA/YrhL
MMPSVRPLGAVPHLTGIRGIAISLVLLYHLFPQAAPGGFIGVDLFFVLSGFLITTLLLDERTATGSISFGKFYARRALRLLPALWVALAVFLVVGFIAYAGAERQSIFNFVIASTFDFANFAVVFGLPVFAAHTWSLSAEEQFYVIWPAIFAMGLAAIAANKVRPHTLIVTLLTVGAASAVVRAALWYKFSDWGRLYYNPFFHSDGLLLGCALALARSWGILDVRTTRTLSLIGLVGIMGLLVGTFTLHTDRGFLYMGGYFPVVLAAAAAVYAAAERPSGRALGWLTSRPLVATGRISYAIYIWSGLLLYYFSGPFSERLLGSFVVIAISTASYFVVERPALRLKVRFDTRRFRSDDARVAGLPVVSAVGTPATPPRLVE